VHIDAVGASIDLRGSELDQVKQRFFQAALVKVLLEAEHCFVSTGGDFCSIETRFHNLLQVS
jgi:hypothetical protein